MQPQWTSQPELKGVARVHLNIPLACYMLPTNEGKYPRNPTRQRRSDPNHGRLVIINHDDGEAKAGDSGVYLEFVGTGNHGTKHRILLIEPNGTFGPCLNVRENRFMIKANSLCFVFFDQLKKDEHAHYRINTPHPKPWKPAVSVPWEPYPGYPGKYSDPQNPRHIVAPDAGFMVDNVTDRCLATIGMHMVQQGIDRLSGKLVEAIQLRLSQWIGYYDYEGDVDAVESLADSNAEEDEVRPYPVDQMGHPLCPWSSNSVNSQENDRQSDAI